MHTYCAISGTDAPCGLPHDCPPVHDPRDDAELEHMAEMATEEGF